jgi:hypothetical protein
LRQDTEAHDADEHSEDNGQGRGLWYGSGLRNREEPVQTVHLIRITVLSDDCADIVYAKRNSTKRGAWKGNGRAVSSSIEKPVLNIPDGVSSHDQAVVINIKGLGTTTSTRTIDRGEAPAVIEITVRSGRRTYDLTGIVNTKQIRLCCSCGVNCQKASMVIKKSMYPGCIAVHSHDLAIIVDASSYGIWPAVIAGKLGIVETREGASTVEESMCPSRITVLAHDLAGVINSGNHSGLRAGYVNVGENSTRVEESVV